MYIEHLTKPTYRFVYGLKMLDFFVLLGSTNSCPISQYYSLVSSSDVFYPKPASLIMISLIRISIA